MRICSASASRIERQCESLLSSKSTLREALTLPCRHPSQLQRRDVKTLLDESMDRAYLERWAARLGVAEALAEIVHE